MPNVDTISAKLAPKEVEQIEKLVRAGHYLNVSDFVRAAVRDKLSEIRLIVERPTDLKEAKKEILRYLRDNEEAYPSDIAAERGLDLAVTMRATRELVEEGRIK
ncbi:MAG TPA: ribbon-helix-helix protein, CopG family [Thermoplasmata archaeon]